MIELKSESLSVGVLPETGGALAYLQYNGQDILRPTLSGETEANYSSMFPMLPYASFIQEGRFPYFGIIRTVEKNSPFSKFPMHGDVWRNKMATIEQSKNSITLSYQHDKKAGFPFAYTAKISYTLNDNRLEIIMRLENNSALPMPFGMGIHPFFKREADTLIQFEADQIWFRGDDPILGHPYTAPSNLNFKSGLPIPANGANISFGSWNNKASLIYPTKHIGIDILADHSFRHLILYTQKGKDFFCLEPVTNTPDAFNLASLGVVGTGIQSLGPKQTVSGKIEFIMKGLK
ncbi:MAG: aldose 1-epimerase [Alphaproteobacteria bacterium]